MKKSEPTPKAPIQNSFAREQRKTLLAERTAGTKPLDRNRAKKALGRKHGGGRRAK